MGESRCNKPIGNLPMSRNFRLILLATMTSALLFGFLHLFFPADYPYDFERLHIFLFNLCCGATVLLFHSLPRDVFHRRTAVFFLFSLCYAVTAFLKLYIPAIAISIFLFAIVESVRVKKFSFFPKEFFDTSPVSVKFHHAALLCLSIGLLLSIAAIVNEEFHPFFPMHMVRLNTFFLGFSFPISLVTMSVMFSFMKRSGEGVSFYLRLYSFWAINLGVIVFFVFILLEMPHAQVFMSSALFVSVILIYVLFRKYGDEKQQKHFLTSGMLFLVSTAITGILYILYHFYLDYDDEFGRFLLRFHAFTALYGWNLNGLAILCRYDDFPIRLHSRWVISLHWAIVLILAPMGYYNRAAAVFATVAYGFILYIILLSKGNRRPVLHR